MTSGKWACHGRTGVRRASAVGKASHARQGGVQSSFPNRPNKTENSGGDLFFRRFGDEIFRMPAAKTPFFFRRKIRRKIRRPRPTENPSKNPSKNPSENPSKNPSKNPSENPSENPSKNPPTNPSKNPSKNPSEIRWWGRPAARHWMRECV